MESIERTGQKHYFGRCICCGNGYDKDDWRWERTMFEEEYGYDEWENMYNVAFKSHEGNGVCFECADEIMKKLKLLRRNVKEAQQKTMLKKKKIKLVIMCDCYNCSKSFKESELVWSEEWCGKVCQECYDEEESEDEESEDEEA